MTEPIAIFFGSTTGNTAEVAEQIAELLPYECDVYDLADTPITTANNYSSIIFGISTWDFGELQEDWDDQWANVDDLALAGKTVALFGLGDQLGYGEWFVDAMGILHDKLAEQGARFIGQWPNEGYDFEASKALTANQSHFVGLALDQDTQRSETDERIEAWVQLIARSFEESL